MTAEAFPLNSPLRLTATFTNLITGQPQSPTDPTLILVNPKEERQTVPLVDEVSPGVFIYELLASLGGRWRARAKSTQGLITGGKETPFWVEDTELS